MAIDKWLQDLSEFWKSKNIEGVLGLFSDDVEYWETPYKKLKSKKEITNEWQSVLSQENLVISTTIFASENNKHSVVWGIAYDKAKIQHVWAGAYLIELDDNGRCTYFMQTGEKK